VAAEAAESAAGASRRLKLFRAGVASCRGTANAAASNGRATGPPHQGGGRGRAPRGVAGMERRDGSDWTRRRGAGMRCGEGRRSGARRGGQGRGAAAEGAAGRGGAATKRGAGRLPSGVGGQQGAAGCGGAMRGGQGRGRGE
jgi:hypothetical protein